MNNKRIVAAIKQLVIDFERINYQEKQIRWNKRKNQMQSFCESNKQFDGLMEVINTITIDEFDFIKYLFILITLFEA